MFGWLAAPPAVVTDDARPGLGCGDQNHEHERNGDCKSHESNGSDDGAVDDDVAVPCCHLKAARPAGVVRGVEPIAVAPDLIVGEPRTREL